MEENNKFNIGNEVYIIYDNIIYRGIIIDIFKKSNEITAYEIVFDDRTIGSNVIDKENVFKNKKEALKELSNRCNVPFIILFRHYLIIENSFYGNFDYESFKLKYYGRKRN